jgi:threonine dehydratase
MTSDIIPVSTPLSVNAGDVQAAAGRIAPHARLTPVVAVTVDGRPVTLKLEHMQVTGSFKFRGALNALAASPGAGPVVAASGGNHGAGVAAAARLLGRPAAVCVPHGTPEAKTRRIAAQGAEVMYHGERYADAESAARRLAAESGATFVHPYNDPAVIAGQGTTGREIAWQAPGCDTVVAAAGGGGLAAGLAVGAGPTRTVVAVEPEHCNALHAAFAAGEPADAPADSVASSALGASRAGELPFALLSGHAARLALVTDREIIGARDRLWEELRLAVEPAAAVPFAAWLAGRVPGRHPCLVLSGANTDWRPA